MGLLYTIIILLIALIIIVVLLRFLAHILAIAPMYDVHQELATISAIMRPV